MPIIDAHLDLATNALLLNRDLRLPLEELNNRERGMSDHPCRGRATVSLPELERAGVVVCCATLLARVRSELAPARGFSRFDLDYAAAELAHAAAAAQLAYYELLAERGALTFIRSSADLDAHWSSTLGNDPPIGRGASGNRLADSGGRGSAAGMRIRAGSAPLGIILSMEGADPIVEPEALAWWRERGLRVLSLVHYGHGRYATGTGVPGGVTPEGIALLREIERSGLILDTSHLADRAFDEALDHCGAAVMASHNNCRSLVPGDRQLSDAQIRTLAQRGAVIGVVCDTWMLMAGWERGVSTPDMVGIETIADHIDHIAQVSGDVGHVAIGSDLDGLYGTEQTPRELKSIADLSLIDAILDRRGYSEDERDRVFWKNWLEFFRRHLPGTDAGTAGRP